MPIISGTIRNYAYKDFVRSMKVNSTFSITGTTTGADSGTVLIDEDANFFASGVLPGDSVSNDTDSSTATVVSVDSATQITTDALSGGSDDTYQAGDDYTIANATSVRAVLYRANKVSMLRNITGNSDSTAAALKIYKQEDLSNSKFDATMPQTNVWQIDPEFELSQRGETIIVDLTVASAGKLNISWEAH